MRIEIAQAAECLKQCEDVYILIHQSPDGDCVGAGFALMQLLHAMGKRAKVLCPEPIPARYGFLTAPDSGEFPAKYVIGVDVADLQLLGNLRSTYEGHVDLCIDHHISNTDYADRVCVDPDASAACQVLYEIIQALGMPLTDSMAACIYTGIATDTGCFKYENATARAHEIVAKLKREHALPYARINRTMFDVKSLGRLKMERAVMEIMEFYLDGRCTMICVTQDILRQMQVEEAELDGIAGLPLQVEGVEVGVTLKEKEPGFYKISMRSADRANVSRICGQLGGGGHVKAAGCALRGTLSQVKEILVRAVEQELALL